MEGFQERKEPGIAPPPALALVPLPPSQSLGGGEGQARCPQPLASNFTDPGLGPSCCLWDWGGESRGLGGAQAVNNGMIFLDNGGLVRKPGWERRGNSLSPRVTGLTSQPGLDLTSPNLPPKNTPPS